MKTHAPRAGFTLVEMLTVMAVIVILASLVLAVNGSAQRKAAVLRAQGEIKAFEQAIGNYSADNNGTVPRKEGVTEPTADGDTAYLEPRLDAIPTTQKYKDANLVLYKALSGDDNLNFRSSSKAYFEFKPNQLKTKMDKGVITEVQYMQDPWGNAYGYSTSGMLQEEAYREELRKDATAKRPTNTKLHGYNPTPDIWSTGGSLSATKGTGTTSGEFRDQPKWVKNWR